MIGSQFASKVGRENYLLTSRQKVSPDTLMFDILVDDLNKKISNIEEYSHAILLPAAPNIDACVNEKLMWKKVMVDGTKRIVDVLVENDVTPVFLSSDYVFDGVYGNYTENDQTNPIVNYGRFKTIIENYLIRSKQPHLIVRLSKVVGAFSGFRNILWGWCEEIHRRGLIKCAIDHQFTPIDIGDAVEILEILCSKEYNGIFHICGTETFSHQTLFELLCFVLKKRPRPITFQGKLELCSINELNLMEVRPLNISMCPDKTIAATGIMPKSVASVCKEVAKQFNSDV